MKLEEMKSKSEQELEEQVTIWKKELVKMKFAASLEKKAEKPHQFKETKKQIARAKTLINQKR